MGNRDRSIAHLDHVGTGLIVTESEAAAQCESSRKAVAEPVN